MKSTKKLTAKKKAAPKATPQATPVRKIVQIAIAAQGGYTCLCDDGTMWYGLPGNWTAASIDGIIFDTPPPPPPPAEPADA
jgi:hypothetical protein